MFKACCAKTQHVDGVLREEKLHVEGTCREETTQWRRVVRRYGKLCDILQRNRHFLTFLQRGHGAVTARCVMLLEQVLQERNGILRMHHALLGWWHTRLLLRNFVAQPKWRVCHTLLQSLATSCATKIWIRTSSRTSSIFLQLVAETVNADWSILVYVQLFMPTY